VIDRRDSRIIAWTGIWRSAVNH